MAKQLFTFEKTADGVHVKMAAVADIELTDEALEDLVADPQGDAKLIEQFREALIADLEDEVQEFLPALKRQLSLFKTS
jgi:hypothetical protein